MLCFKHSELTQENVHKIKIVLKYGEENVGEITRQELLGSSWAKSEILRLRNQRGGGGSSDDSGVNNNQENDTTINLAISKLLASPEFESTSITSQFIKIISENGFCTINFPPWGIFHQIIAIFFLLKQIEKDYRDFILSFPFFFYVLSFSDLSAEFLIFFLF